MLPDPIPGVGKESLWQRPENSRHRSPLGPDLEGAVERDDRNDLGHEEYQEHGFDPFLRRRLAEACTNASPAMATASAVRFLSVLCTAVLGGPRRRRKLISLTQETPLALSVMLVLRAGFMHPHWSLYFVKSTGNHGLDEKSNPNLSQVIPVARAGADTGISASDDPGPRLWHHLGSRLALHLTSLTAVR